MLNDVIKANKQPTHNTFPTSKLGFSKKNNYCIKPNDQMS